MDDNEKSRLYRNLMVEAMFRLDLVDAIYEARATSEARVVREICYLQFRFLCEIIALGCIVAHGSYTKRLLETREPDKILNEMQKLNEHFYPQPIEATFDPATKAHNIKVTPQKNHLTKKELAKLWGKCGDALHLAPLKKALKAQSHDPDLKDIVTWSAKLSGLLADHIIALKQNPTSQQVILFSRKYPSTGQLATVVCNVNF